MRRLVGEQLDAFKRNFEHGRPALRAQQEPDPLRRADHRLDDRARGAGRQGAAAHRVGDLQPAAARHPARHRRHRALRHRQLDEAADACPSCRTRARTTRACTRACRPGRSAARAWPRSRPPPARPRPDYLFYVAAVCGNGKHTVRGHRRRVPALRGRATTARATSAAASRRPTAEHARGRPRLPGRRTAARRR